MSEEVLRPPGRGDVMSEVCRDLLGSAACRKRRVWSAPVPIFLFWICYG